MKGGREGGSDEGREVEREGMMKVEREGGREVEKEGMMKGGREGGR